MVGSEPDAGCGSVEVCRPPRLGVGDRASQIGILSIPSALKLGISQIGRSRSASCRGHVAELRLHNNGAAQVRVA
jgi:hypothetical protein